MNLLALTSLHSLVTAHIPTLQNILRQSQGLPPLEKSMLLICMPIGLLTTNYLLMLRTQPKLLGEYG
jgi:hypothetical protein